MIILIIFSTIEKLKTFAKKGQNLRNLQNRIIDSNLFVINLVTSLESHALLSLGLYK